MASSQMKTRRNRVIAYIVTGILLLMSGVSKAPAQDSGGKIVKYHATINDVKYVYGVAEPVARLKSGDILETNTVDAFGNAIQKPGDTLRDRKSTRLNSSHDKMSYAVFCLT